MRSKLTVVLWAAVAAFCLSGCLLVPSASLVPSDVWLGVLLVAAPSLAVLVGAGVMALLWRWVSAAELAGLPASASSARGVASEALAAGVASFEGEPSGGELVAGLAGRGVEGPSGAAPAGGRR